MEHEPQLKIEFQEDSDVTNGKDAVWLTGPDFGDFVKEAWHPIAPFTKAIESFVKAIK
ncbi:unnamed protein product [Dovyalis caffra]|uniref:Uncharacterized protein n=1 Tax=Dovyalis caffra TaxID=77055 RepID=A0AAV1S4V8_9ROSI|nr:unnamed protein product [Dovyalis caffra]